MKFLTKFQDFRLNEEFNAQSIIYKIIVGDVNKDQLTGQYEIWYNNASFTKGNAIFKIYKEGNESVYKSQYNLNKPEFPVTGTFDVQISTTDAVKGKQLPIKINQNNKFGTGIMNTKLSQSGGMETDVPRFDLNADGFFAPNVDTIDEAKKTQLNTELDRLNVYYNDNKGKLTKPGASVKFNIIGGASLVTTTYAGGNQKLAETRANNLKTYMIAYFKTTNPSLSGYIANVSEVTTVIGKTPYVQGQDNPQDEKYRKEQFVKVSISM